ncbi:hypothetical protein QC632_11755 [Methylomonas sp. UP202]|nr:hypothetical protein [Methylomonas sp. UP202]WGS88408.1 hypothetical protein QC632_11755 [Methylomonas sp. UP202]
MRKSKNLTRDIFTAITFTAGMFVFMSGEFILSTVLFCLASISSNLDSDARTGFNDRRAKHR